MLVYFSDVIIIKIITSPEKLKNLSLSLRRVWLGLRYISHLGRTESPEGWPGTWQDGEGQPNKYTNTNTTYDRQLVKPRPATPHSEEVTALTKLACVLCWVIY